MQRRSWTSFSEHTQALLGSVAGQCGNESRAAPARRSPPVLLARCYGGFDSDSRAASDREARRNDQVAMATNDPTRTDAYPDTGHPTGKKPTLNVPRLAEDLIPHMLTN